MLSSTFAKVYLLCGLGLIGGYSVMENRGVVFGGTDQRPAAYAARSGRRSGGTGGGGFFFWGSGYRGGK